MDKAVKQQIVWTILERASDIVGDITESVMDEFYQTANDTKDLFTQHRPVNTVQLEAAMVEQALYCFMYWYENSEEIRITLLGSVPHHVETLNVSIDQYHKLMQATASVIGKTIPTEQQTEMDVWNEISDSLHEILDLANQYVYGEVGNSEPQIQSSTVLCS